MFNVPHDPTRGPARLATYPSATPSRSPGLDVSLAAIALALVTLAAHVPPTTAAVWESIGPDAVGPTQGIAQAPSNPNRLYLSIRFRGFWRSDDRGETWGCVNPEQSYLGRFAVSPVDPDIVVAGIGGRFLRSTDGGHTWAESSEVGDWTSTRSVEFDPQEPVRVLAAVGGPNDTGLYLSTDSGLTWTPVAEGIDDSAVNTVSFHPAGGGVALVGTDEEIYRTTDGGTSWTPVGATGQTGGMEVDYCGGGAFRAWVVDSEGEVWLSDDGGESFVPSPSEPVIPFESQLVAVAAHPTDPDAVVAGVRQRELLVGYSRVRGIARSTDGGSSWSVRTEPFLAGLNFGTVRELVFDLEEPDLVYLSTLDPSVYGLFRSTDAGDTWQTWTVGGVHNLGIMAIDRDLSGRIYAREGSLNGLWIASSVGGPWTYGAVRDEFWIYDPTAFEVNHRTVGLVHEGGFRQLGFDAWVPTYSRSTDGGLTWAIDLALTGVISWNVTLASNCGDGGATYVWDWDRLHRSLDGGPFEVLAQDSQPLAAVVHPDDPLRVFAVNESYGVRLTTDGGVSWLDRSAGLPAGAFPRHLFLDPASPERLAVAFNFSIHRSDDAGLSWYSIPTDIEPGLLFRAVDWDPVYDRFAISVTELGVYLTDRGFVSAGLPSGLGVRPPVRFVPSTGHLLLGTGGNGVWALDLEDPVPANLPPATARELDLVVRPNPSHGQVRIELAIPEGRGSAEVAIFAVDGRRIVTLGRGLTRGASLSWDGRNARGAASARGVYFVRATADGATADRKLVLIGR
jgi:photosystem II stability/assembly factor-like uncharacterized protein